MHRDRQMTPRLKCDGQGCPIAKKCWRFIAPSHPYSQDYLGSAPFSVETAMCPDHWPVRRYDADVIAGRRIGDHSLATGAASTPGGSRHRE